MSTMSGESLFDTDRPQGQEGQQMDDPLCSASRTFHHERRSSRKESARGFNLFFFGHLFFKLADIQQGRTRLPITTAQHTSAHLIAT